MDRRRTFESSDSVTSENSNEDFPYMAAGGGNYSYTISEHTECLSAEIDNTPSFVHPTSFALSYCKRKVLRPYFKTLAVVGWRPLIYRQSSGPDLTPGLKIVNTLYPIGFLLFIIFGYLIQICAQFRRDRPTTSPEEQIFPINDSNGSIPIQNIGPGYSVLFAHSKERNEILSVYAVPDVLHLIAYIYMLYLFRVAEAEQMKTMIELVFLRSTGTHAGFLKQKRVIRSMFRFMFFAVFFVVTSLCTQILHAFVVYPINFNFVAINSLSAKIILTVIMIAALLFIDIVSIAVMVVYAGQCQLLIVLISTMIENVREKSISIQHAMRDIEECGKLLSELNDWFSPAVSILIFNYMSLIILTFDALLGKNVSEEPVMYLATVLRVILWILIIIMPLFQAARVTAKCLVIRRLGHEIRTRPFGYADTPQAELDSFLMYTASCRHMWASLFMCKVKWSTVCTLLTITAFIVLILCQLDVLLM